MAKIDDGVADDPLLSKLKEGDSDDVDQSDDGNVVDYNERKADDGLLVFHP